MRVTFKKDTHEYFNERKEKYISATTLISRYKNPFDSGYWSYYKAIKDILDKNNLWNGFKIQCGGWKNVVKSWTANPIFKEEVLDRKAYYLHKWKAQSQEALEKGSALHKIKEDEIINSNGHRDEKGKVSLNLLTEDLMLSSLEGDGIVVEALLWNHKYKIAGQADKVYKYGNIIDIDDYKTNRELSRTSFMDQKMKYPLAGFPDCDFYHYQLQLSLYGWMLEQIGYQVRNLRIIHITEESEIPFKVNYVKQEVEKMLNHFANVK